MPTKYQAFLDEREEAGGKAGLGDPEIARLKDIEKLIDDDLPPSARSLPPSRMWSNTGGGLGQKLRETGWQVWKLLLPELDAVLLVWRSTESHNASPADQCTGLNGD